MYMYIYICVCIYEIELGPPTGPLWARPLWVHVGSYGPGNCGPTFGSFEPGPCGPPGAIVGRALMDPWALMGQALVGSPGLSWAGP